MLRKTTTAILTAALIASACGGDPDPGEETGVATTQAVDVSADVSEPNVAATSAVVPEEIVIGDGFGSYDVGVDTITVLDGSGGDRDLTVEVWFPLDDSTGLAPSGLTFPGDLVLESAHAFVATSKDISRDGPFPLVVYSHGGSAIRTSNSNFAEAIASHGYVVAAPDHLGDTVLDSSDDVATKLFNRPNDISAVIDAMVDTDRTKFARDVDADQVAVTGFQAFTVYAVASGYDNQRGDYQADERVDAIVAMAPTVQALDDERLAAIDIPALVMTGTIDYSSSATRPWELSNSSPSYRVDIVGADHLSFTDICAYVALLDANPDADAGDFRNLMNGFRSRGCRPDDFPYERAQDIINTFATTFLDSVFRGTPAIRPDQVDGRTDLNYQAK